MLPGKKAEIVLNQKVLKAFKQKAQQGTSNDSDSPPSFGSYVLQ